MPARLTLLLLLASCGPNAEETYDLDVDGYAAGTDCNDKDPTVHPGAPERCNHVDDDCDGLVDVDPVDGRTFYVDADGDDHGDPGSEVQACAWSQGLVREGDDCDDTDPAVHPGAQEDDCRDKVDYNCDGQVGYTDADFDGYPACEDCDDRDPTSHPGGTEVCDGRDNDCDHTADEEGTPGAWPAYADDDGDLWGDPDDSRMVCALPVGFVENDGDCDDTDADIHPEAEDPPGDGIDQDCDGAE